MMKHKVFAYFTSGTRLLVFRHPYLPEAGIQVPAGTLEEGEQPHEGVLNARPFTVTTTSDQGCVPASIVVDPYNDQDTVVRFNVAGPHSADVWVKCVPCCRWFKSRHCSILSLGRHGGFCHISAWTSMDAVP